jgi:hypothetical protein
MRLFTAFMMLIALLLLVLYTQEIPKTGLVAYYKFDEGAGTIVTDSSGFGLDGEIMGGAEYTEGKVGDGLMFNGIDSYVNMGDVPELNVENEITLMAWVYPYDLTDGGEHDPWISKGDNQYALKNGAGDYFEFFVYDGASWHAPQVPVDSSYNETWHHYAGTFDGFELKMFIDGEMRLAAPDPYEGPINTTEYDFYLGSNSQATGRYFEGILDEVLVYEIALSEEEVLAVYNSYSISAVDEQPVRMATHFSLEQNYPNPFNPSTTISYQLPMTSNVELSIYNLLGQKVALLVSQRQAAGTYRIDWNAGDLPSGVYLYRLQAGSFSQMRKMALIK